MPTAGPASKKDKAKPAYENAIRMVREEIAKNPNQTEQRIDLAMYLAKSGDKEEALKEMKPVEAAHDTNPSDLYNSALVYELVRKARPGARRAPGCRQSWTGSERHQERA